MNRGIKIIDNTVHISDYDPAKFFRVVYDDGFHEVVKATSRNEAASIAKKGHISGYDPTIQYVKEIDR